MLDLALFFVVDTLDFGKDSRVVYINQSIDCTYVIDFVIKWVIVNEIMP